MLKNNGPFQSIGWCNISPSHVITKLSKRFFTQVQLFKHSSSLHFLLYMLYIQLFFYSHSNTYHYSIFTLNYIFTTKSTSMVKWDMFYCFWFISLDTHYILWHLYILFYLKHKIHQIILQKYYNFHNIYFN